MAHLCHTTYKYSVANATLFYFLFHRLVLRWVHFTYSNFAWGLHGGVGVKCSGGLLVFWTWIDVIVVRVKVSRGFEPLSPMGIDSADTSQPPIGVKGVIFYTSRAGTCSLLWMWNFLSYVRRKVNRPASSTWQLLARVYTPSRTQSWGALGTYVVRAIYGQTLQASNVNNTQYRS